MRVREAYMLYMHKHDIQFISEGYKTMTWYDNNISIKRDKLTIRAIHAVKYPLPDPTSKACAPGLRWSLNASRA